MENTGYCEKDNKYKGASDKSKESNNLYKSYCKNNKILYVDNNDLQTGIDGVHLTQQSHTLLAQKLSTLIKTL